MQCSRGSAGVVPKNRVAAAGTCGTRESVCLCELLHQCGASSAWFVWLRLGERWCGGRTRTSWGGCVRWDKCAIVLVVKRNRSLVGCRSGCDSCGGKVFFFLQSDACCLSYCVVQQLNSSTGVIKRCRWTGVHVSPEQRVCCTCQTLSMWLLSMRSASRIFLIQTYEL